MENINTNNHNSHHVVTVSGLDRSVRSIKSDQYQLDFKNLSVNIDKQQILKDVFGQAHPGQMLAIMGPSGAGKTTLLNCLAGRRPIDSGELTVNSNPINKKIRRHISYVLQNDIFLPGLTCWETLWYTALLRLPETMNQHEKKTRVDEIIDCLDMRKCLHTPIGSEFIRGLSGGEKKRTSIACELLTDPALILLDEPTSGLDSSTAFNLVASLKKVAQMFGKTVVMTIHQPSSQIFHMFDRLLLLAEGQVAYYGDVDHCASHFASFGLNCPPTYNLSDYILDQVKERDEIKTLIFEKAFNTRQAVKLSEEADWERVSRDYGGKLPALENRFTKGSPETDCGINNGGFTKTSLDDLPQIIVTGSRGYMRDTEESSIKSTGEVLPKWPTGFLMQFSVLFRRSMKDAMARVLNREALIQMAVIGLIAGFLWFRTEPKEESLSDRLGIFFFYLIFCSAHTVTVSTLTFVGERAVVIKERLGGYYRLSAYVLAKYLADMCVVGVPTAIVFTLLFWLSGVNYNFGVFLLMYLVLLLCTLVAQSVGEFFGALIFNVSLAFTCSLTSVLCAMLAGGFYVKKIPIWAAWLKYISFLSHAFYTTLELDFRNNQIQCAEFGTIFKSCMTQTDINNGTLYIHQEELINMYTLSKEGFVVWHHIVILLSMAIIPKIATYTVFRFIQKPKIN